MRVLIEIGHPAHVHFFRHAITRLREEGHYSRVVTRDKDIANELLKRYEIPFECLSRPATGKFGLMRELLLRWLSIGRIIRQEKIDLAVSIAGISTSFPAWRCGIRNIMFQDTEDATLSNRIAIPYTDQVYTPSFFLKDLGKKQVRYQGLHELAYLQGFNFARAAQTRKQLGLPERYSVIRVVANQALHDGDIRGLSERELESLIQHLSRWGAVVITSEGPLPAKFETLRLRAPLENVHEILAGARAFVGESPTMAVEASLLGTPAFLISQRWARLGNMVCLERDLGLLKNFSSWRDLEPALQSLDLETTRDQWGRRARSFREGATDMTELIVSAISGKAFSCAA